MVISCNRRENVLRKYGPSSTTVGNILSTVAIEKKRYCMLQLSWEIYGQCLQEASTLRSKYPCLVQVLTIYCNVSKCPPVRVEVRTCSVSCCSRCPKAPFFPRETGGPPSCVGCEASPVVALFQSNLSQGKRPTQFFSV